MKKRIFPADVIRVVAIYLVLTVHSYTLVQKDIFFTLSSLFTTSAVPLFVVLSGMLLLSKKEKFLTFYKKRVLRVLLPWSTWSFLSTLYLLGSGSIVYSIPVFLSTFWHNFLGYWFLPMIVGLYVISPILKILVSHLKKRNLIYLILFGFIVTPMLSYMRDMSLFTEFANNILSVKFVGFIGYYLLGYYIYKYEVGKKNLIFTFFLFLWGVGWTFYAVLQSGNFDPNTYGNRSLGNILFNVSVFIFILRFSEKAEIKLNTRFRKLIVSLSGVSFGMYLSHLLIRNILTSVLSFYPVTANSILTRYLNSFVLFVVCYIVLILLTKDRLLRKLLT